jgi:hypothetical protein
MSLILFEDLMEEQVGMIPAIDINATVSRKPSFGWGNSPALRKFLDQYQEAHNPLVWSVPLKTIPSPNMGMTRRPVQLNLCAIESRTELLNSARLRPNFSFKKVLIPLWEAIERRFELSSINMLEDEPAVILYPDYKIVDRVAGNAVDKNEGQYFWDVLRLEFTVEFSKNYTPCKN